MADTPQVTSVELTSPETMEKMTSGLTEPQKTMFAESQRLGRAGAKEQAQKSIEAEQGLLRRQQEIGRKEKSYIEDAEKGLIEPKAFEPTRENAADLAGIFSIVTIAGLFSGGKGRYSSTAALNNMAAAMEGYRKGRKDLFDREMKEFEKNLKATQEHNSFIKSKIDNYLKLLSVDKDLAQQEAKVLQAEAAGSKLAVDAERGNIQELLKTDLALTRMDKQLQGVLARVAASQGKIDSKTKGEIRGNLSTLANISDLSNMLPTVPDAGRIFGIIAGNVPENIQQYYASPQARQAISLLQNISSQILKLRSGATVTVAEFARQRGFLPQRSDSPEAIQDKLRGLWDAISNETTGYGLTKNQLNETVDELQQIPPPLSPSYRPSVSGGAPVPGTQVAPQQPRAKLNNRTIVVRGGKWVYEDTGEEAK